jgi:hypothetical protein
MRVQVIVGMVVLVLIACVGWCVGTAEAQTTQTLRAQWEMTGPPAPAGGVRPPFDIATAQGYVYKIYQVGAAIGTTLTGVTCTTTADQYVKTCAATVPSAFNVAGLSVDLTATINGVETAHSNAAVVPPVIVPPAPPSNLRLQRVVGTATVTDSPDATAKPAAK